MKPLRLAFAGTAPIAVPLLRALHADSRFDVVAVITQGDKPAGRKQLPTASAVKKAAQELNLKILEPVNVNAKNSQEALKNLKIDVLLVFAYGQILKPPLLALASHGALNVHTSLLPHHRGASPIQTALLAGDAETGVSLMQMTATLDAGPVFEMFAVPICPQDTTETLHQTLAHLAASSIPNALMHVATGTLKAQPQNEAEATYARKLIKIDGLLTWAKGAAALERQVRAFYGWPGAYTFFNGRRLTVHQARAHEGLLPRHQTAMGECNPGKVIKKDDKVGVACGTGSDFLELVLVQPEGGKTQSVRDFLNGHPHFLSYTLG